MSGSEQLVLVTGGAGIGAHTAKALRARGRAPLGSIVKTALRWERGPGYGSGDRDPRRLDAP